MKIDRSELSLLTLPLRSGAVFQLLVPLGSFGPPVSSKDPFPFPDVFLPPNNVTMKRKEFNLFLKLIMILVWY